MWRLIVLLLAVGSVSTQMEVLYEWNTVDFTFPPQSDRRNMISTGKFIPENVALIDVDIWDGGIQLGRKVFVTMPRFKPGVPATLATVGPNNLLTPYPNWSWHSEEDCNGITSVFRVQVDECDRLWVLDTGTINTFTSDVQRICPPQILIFNLRNNGLIGKYRFPDSVLDPDSLLITIVADTRGPQCYDTFAYIADVVAYKLIVYDARQHRSWRVNSNYFYPYPLQGRFNINGVKFDLMDGIIGLALGPFEQRAPGAKRDRKLFFHSLASVRESWVMTSIIRNESLHINGNQAPEAFEVSEYERSSQSAAEAMTPSGVLFFGLLSENSIACWNSKTTYAPENIYTVAQDYYILQFASGMKIHNGYIWVLTSRFQNYINEDVDDYNINYRIVVGSVPLMTYGSSCYDPADSTFVSALAESYSPFYDTILIKK